MKILKFLCKTCRNGWTDGPRCKTCKCGPQPGAYIDYETDRGVYCTVYYPPKPRDMTPLQYYKKYKCVPKRYKLRQANGRYYCNPAHCSQSWKNKEKRDEHLKQAYAILG